MRRLGPMSQVLGMIPGMGKLKANVDLEDLDDGFLTKVEAIISSMTVDERRRPEILNASRRRRIARGSGTTIQDVNQLLNQYKETKKIMKAVASGRAPTLALPGLR